MPGRQNSIQKENIVSNNGYDQSGPFLNTACFKPNGVIQATAKLTWGNIKKEANVRENVSGKNWGTGCLISNDLFLTAGHCLEPKYSIRNGKLFTKDGWLTPYVLGKGPLQPTELAPLFDIRLNSQHSSCYANDFNQPIIQEKIYPVEQLIEYNPQLDYAILKIGGNPGKIFGHVKLSINPLNYQQNLYIVQHPAGAPKKIARGEFQGYSDNGVDFYYNINTLGGSSGSGVAINDNTIAGVHVSSYDETVNHAISMRAIYNNSPTVRAIVNNYGLFAKPQKNTNYITAKPKPPAYQIAPYSLNEDSLFARLHNHIDLNTIRAKALMYR